jgi:hypothetical protein
MLPDPDQVYEFTCVFSPIDDFNSFGARNFGSAEFISWLIGDFGKRDAGSLPRCRIEFVDPKVDNLPRQIWSILSTGPLMKGGFVP